MQGRKNLTRVPQVFTLDSNIITRAYGKESPIIRDILVFVANKSTMDFFGEVVFSLAEFCDAFGYNKDEMQRTLPQFVECNKRDLPIEGGHCFDSVFEYALYKGFRTSLVFSNKQFEGKGFDLSNMLLFSRIQAIYKDTGRREKRQYLVELDYRIKQWQMNRYFLTDQELYRSIKIPRSIQLTGGLRNFYLYLGRIASQIKEKLKNGEEASFDLTVDECAKIMDISYDRNDNRKRRVKDFLDRLKVLLGNQHFDYTFYKGDNQRYEYNIKFILAKETLIYYDEKLNAVFFNKLNNGVSVQYFKSFVSNKMLNYSKWVNNLSSNEKKEISKWLFNKSSGEIDKAKKFFVATFEEVFEQEYDGRFGEI